MADRPFDARAVARSVRSIGKSMRYGAANEFRKNLPAGFTIQELSRWHWRLTSGGTVVDYWPTKQRALTIRGEPRLGYWKGTLQELVAVVSEGRTDGD